MVRTTLFTKDRFETGTVRSIWDHLHKRTHLVPESRSDPYRIHHVPCEHTAYPHQFPTGSKQIRFRVNTAYKWKSNFLVFNVLLRFFPLICKNLNIPNTTKYPNPKGLKIQKEQIQRSSATEWH